MAAPTPDPRIKPLPNAKSKIWEWFGFEIDEGENIKNKKEAICGVCTRIIPYSGNTTNLRQHLREHHPEQYGRFEKADQEAKKPRGNSQLTLAEAFRKRTPYTKTGPKYLELQDALARFLCEGLQPLSIVESPSFVGFCQKLNDNFELPGRKKMTTSVIPKKYEEVKKAVQQQIGGAEALGLTTDLWTGRHSRAYASLTAHYVSDDWVMKSFALQTSELPGVHDHTNIANDLKKSMRKWEITNTVVGYTTDNGSNIKKAIIDDLKMRHIPCVGHTLQLSVGKLLKVNKVARILGRCKKLVVHFKSTKQADLLREKQQLLGRSTRALIQSVETRWNSSYEMLKRIQDEQQALCAALLTQPTHIKALLPEVHEWAIIDNTIKLLQPFYDATKIMSSSSNTTISMVAPLKYSLLNNQLVTDDTDDDEMKAFKRAVADDLASRYSEPSLVKFLRKASFLDPRFKDMEYVPETEREAIIESVKCDMADIATGQQPQPPEVNVPEQNAVVDQEEVEAMDMSDPETEPQDPATSTPKRSALCQLFGASKKQKVRNLTLAERINNEMRKYLSEEEVDLDDLNPLDWWRERQVLFPNMATLVRHMWCLPASSVRSEELFSTAGNILCPKRARLLPDNVDKLVFLAENWNADGKPCQFEDEQVEQGDN